MKNVFEEKFPVGFQTMEKQFGRPEFLEKALNLGYFAEVVKGDPSLENQFARMRELFFEYTEILLRYDEQLTKSMENNPNIDEREIAEELARIDEQRRLSHNAMISDVNVFARMLGSAGKDNAWVKKLGTADNRSAYGQLALATTFLELKKRKEEDHGEPEQV
jgi:hypothetical protein